MESSRRERIERLQGEVARLVATNPAGERLCLIGGFRYRLLDRSCRASLDIDYHWDGDLEEKRDQLLALFARKLLPEVERRLSLEGRADPATSTMPGGVPDSTFVAGVTLAFYRTKVPGSRLELPVEITRIPVLDAPVARTVAGTVYLTASDADMVESKVIAVVRRVFLAERDLVDLFLFQDALRPDAPARLKEKLARLSLATAALEERIARLRGDLPLHARGIDRILAEEVDASPGANLERAGGGRAVCEAVIRTLESLLAGMRGAGGR